MDSILRKSVVVALVASIAITGIVPMGMSPAGTASASHDCSTTNKVTWFAFLGASAVGEATGGSGAGCDMYHDSTDVQDIRESEDTQTAIDLYAAAVGQSNQNEITQTVTSNYLNDTESIAWQKAEAEIAESYQNDTTKATAKANAREAITEYYAVKQQNIVASWNSMADTAAFLEERSSQSGTQAPFKDEDGYRITNGIDNGVEDVTLVNGTTATTRRYDFEFGSTDMAVAPSNGPQSDVYIVPPNSDYDEEVYVDHSQYYNQFQKVDEKHNSLNSEVDAFVDATWQDYQDGNINASDVISRTTLMFEYGTRTSSGTGNYYDAIGALATMGLDTPDLNGTGQMTIEAPPGGTTYDGLVFARNAPNNEWVVGQTYDASNITGPVMVATTDGQIQELDGEFQITSMTDTDGNSQDSVATTSYNYQTANTSDLQAKYDRLLAMTQEIEDRQDELYAGGGGSGSGFLDFLDNSYLGIPVIGWIAGTLLGLGLLARGGRQ